MVFDPVIVEEYSVLLKKIKDNVETNAQNVLAAWESLQGETLDSENINSIVSEIRTRIDSFHSSCNDVFVDFINTVVRDGEEFQANMDNVKAFLES